MASSFFLSVHSGCHSERSEESYKILRVAQDDTIVGVSGISTVGNTLLFYADAGGMSNNVDNCYKIM